MGTPQNKGIEMVDDDPVPINKSSVGHDFDLNVSLDLNSGIVNEYGQLMSEYTWLDEELWLSKPGEDDDQLELFNEGLKCDYFQSQKSVIVIDQPSEYANNVVSDGGMETVIEKSSSLMNSSPNQPETPIPISIVPSKRSYSDIGNEICSQQPTEHTSSGGLQFLATAISTIEQNPAVQSDSDCTMESSLSDESEEYIPSKEVRTRKISDLLDNKNSNRPVKKCTHCESTETPQWRTGPMGRFTLCNACGVQYKHGRLFADYRPLRSPTYNPSLHFHLPKKVQQIRMGYTSETLSNPTPKRPKPKKVKETKKGNNKYERDPAYTPIAKRVEKMRMGSTCERVPNPTRIFKKVEMRKDNHIDIGQTITSESKRVDEMALDNKKDSSLKVTSEDSILKEVSSVNNSEIELNCEYRAKNSEELQENAINLVEVDSCRRNNNYDSNRIIKQNLVPKEMKKCAHCESTQTPQWREGPEGRHTLCNACGVQYRHGKLFPEYRPLKSPTYNPLLHSHLPKKVLEMRKKNTEKCATSDNLEVIL